MVGKLQPLVNNQRIVGLDGLPTEYFIRWAQQRQIDIGDAIDEAQAIEIIEQFLADHPLIAGSGIGLLPSGNIAEGVTISAEVQAILDQISTTQGTVLFRGASDWEALAPGTAGHFLKTNGAGADPEWAAAGGGGGSAWTLDTTVDLSVSPAATVPFTGLGAYNEILLIGIDTTTSVSSFRGLQVSTDDGATYFNTVGDYKRSAVTGGITNVSQIDGISSSNAAARNFYIHLMNVNVNGVPKPYLTTSLLNGFFTASLAPIDAVQANTTAGNFNGGTLYLLGR